MHAAVNGGEVAGVEDGTVLIVVDRENLRITAREFGHCVIPDLRQVLESVSSNSISNTYVWAETATRRSRERLCAPVCAFEKPSPSELWRQTGEDVGGLSHAHLTKRQLEAERKVASSKTHHSAGRTALEALAGGYRPTAPLRARLHDAVVDAAMTVTERFVHATVNEAARRSSAGRPICVKFNGRVFRPTRRAGVWCERLMGTGLSPRGNRWRSPRSRKPYSRSQLTPRP